MERESFLDILMVSSPEELDEFLDKKGKIKHVNLITFMDEEEDNNERASK